MTEKAQIDNSVSDIAYVSREPESSRFNVGDNIRIVINPTSNWLLYHPRLICTWKAY